MNKPYPVVTVHFKTPDAVHYALKDIEDEDQAYEIQRFIDEYVKYGECTNIEFDLNNKTVKVVR